MAVFKLLWVTEQQWFKGTWGWGTMGSGSSGGMEMSKGSSVKLLETAHVSAKLLETTLMETHMDMGRTPATLSVSIQIKTSRSQASVCVVLFVCKRLLVLN